MTVFARLFPALVMAAALTPAAHALTVVSVSDNGNVVDTSFVQPGQIGLDVSFFNTLPVSVSFMLDAGDAGGSASFNAVMKEVAGGAMTQLRLALTGGALFSAVGAAEALGGAAVASALSAGSTTAQLSTQPGTTEFYIGNALLTGAQDWQINFGPIVQQGNFTLTVTQVPEPQTWALLFGGLGCVIFLLRRRRG